MRTGHRRRRHDGSYTSSGACIGRSTRSAEAASCGSTSNKRGWGALRLTTVGWQSGQERSVIVGYIEDGPDLVVLAMNGWGEGHPAWWRNLEARPDAVVRLAGEPPRAVRARSAAGEERDRLWQRWREVEPELDGYVGRRTTETPVVVFEPREATA